MMTDSYRSYLSQAVAGHGAHITFDQAIEGFPCSRAGEQVPGLPHTVWTLVYHMAVAQNDIIQYCRDPKNYQELEYPSGYWPQDFAPPSEEIWSDTIQQVKAGIETLRSWALDTSRDLFATLPSTPGHTLARQLTIMVAHNGYHIGQIVDLRMLLGVPVKDW